MNPYLLFVIALIVLSYLLNLVTELLNVRAASPDIPEEFAEQYDAEKYAKSQHYLKDSTRFEIFSSTVTTPITLAFIILGGFGWVDGLARSAGFGLIGTGLMFTGILVVLSQLLSLPFSMYDTFGIEAKYGFNKTTPKTFIGDLFKGIVLAVLLGGPILALIIWFFGSFEKAWLWAWLAVFVFQLIILYVAPVWIMPLFNKFEPLAEGELRTEIEAFAEKEGFHLQGLFTTDGSKRSTRANAYFTGFGKNRRIVLFDTLIEKHSVAELVAVLAHEIGHYKLRHIGKGLVVGVLATGLMFYLLSLFISEPQLYAAFGLDASATIQGKIPVYAGLVCFGFLYTPISLLISLVSNVLSRKHEFEADAYAARTTGNPETLITALKGLAVDNLSNLTPHPMKVFLEYSHPPMLVRIHALREHAQ